MFRTVVTRITAHANHTDEKTESPEVRFLDQRDFAIRRLIVLPRLFWGWHMILVLSLVLRGLLLVRGHLLFQRSGIFLSFFVPVPSLLIQALHLFCWPGVVLLIVPLPYFLPLG